MPIATTCNVFFVSRFIADMSSRLEFVVYSVSLNIVEGIGVAAYSTGMYTMATVLYPKSTGTVVVSEEMRENKECQTGLCHFFRVFLKLGLQ